MNWHTEEEKRIIEKAGGKPLSKYGTDGILNGKPIEVRSIRSKKETRYRLMKTTHKDLLKRGGCYIFSLRGKTKKVSAVAIDKIIAKRRWYKDRDYPHTFVYIKEIFTRNSKVSGSKKKSRRTCLERSQLKMLFDVLRKKRKCNAATEFIEQIDEEFTPKKEKKPKKRTKKDKRAWWEEWV